MLPIHLTRWIWKSDSVFFLIFFWTQILFWTDVSKITHLLLTRIWTQNLCFQYQLIFIWEYEKLLFFFHSVKAQPFQNRFSWEFWRTNFLMQDFWSSESIHSKIILSLPYEFAGSVYCRYQHILKFHYFKRFTITKKT